MTGANRRTDQLAETLAQQILTGQLPIGSKMPSDAALCAQYNVSRTILREAFRLLTAKGLLVARPRIGTLVAPRQNWALLDRDMLAWRVKAGDSLAMAAEIHDLRLALEPSLAALAAARADEKANQALQNALRILETDPHSEAAFIGAFYHAAANEMAACMAHLAQWAVQQRTTPLPLTAYRQLTAAVAQNDKPTARISALNALVDA